MIFEGGGRNAESRGERHLHQLAHHCDQRVVMDRVGNGIHKLAANRRGDERGFNSLHRHRARRAGFGNDRDNADNVRRLRN